MFSYKITDRHQYFSWWSNVNLQLNNVWRLLKIDNLGFKIMLNIVILIINGIHS